MEKSFATKIAQIEQILKNQSRNDTVVQKLELKVEETQSTRAKAKQSLKTAQKQHQSTKGQQQATCAHCEALRVDLADQHRVNRKLAKKQKGLSRELTSLEEQIAEGKLSRETVLAILMHKDMQLFEEQEILDQLKTQREQHELKTVQYHDSLRRSLQKMAMDPPNDKLQLVTKNGINKFLNADGYSDFDELDELATQGSESDSSADFDLPSPCSLLSSRTLSGASEVSESGVTVIGDGLQQMDMDTNNDGVVDDIEMVQASIHAAKIQSELAEAEARYSKYELLNLNMSDWCTITVSLSCL